MSLNKKSEMSPIQSPRGKISKSLTPVNSFSVFSTFLKAYFSRICRICDPSSGNQEDFDLSMEVFDLITLVLFKNGHKLSLKSGL